MAKDGISATSIENVVANMNKEISRIAGRTQAGITAAAVFVRAEAQKRSPVNTGNLRNSAYVVTPGGRNIRSAGTKFSGISSQSLLETHRRALEQAAQVAKSHRSEMYAEIGFTAYYAVFVHEIQKNYTVGDWKYLERALLDNKSVILKIIRDRAKVK